MRPGAWRQYKIKTNTPDKTTALLNDTSRAFINPQQYPAGKAPVSSSTSFIN